MFPRHLFRSALPRFLGAVILFAAATAGRGEEHPNYGRQVEADERLKTLEMLITRMQQNYQRIKSWSGTYEATQRVRHFGVNPSLPENQKYEQYWVSGGQPLDRATIKTGPDEGDGFWIIKKGVVRFSLDAIEKKCHASYSALDSDGYIDVPKGAEIRSTRPGDSAHWIITDQFHVQFETESQRGRLPEFKEIDPIRSGRVLYRSFTNKATRRDFMIDPHVFFSIHSFRSDRFLWHHCATYSRWLRGEATNAMQDVAQQKLAIYVSADEPPTYTVVLHFGESVSISQYDGKFGFNLTNDVQTDRKIQFSRHNTTTYRNVAGTFLPEKIERQYFIDNPPEGSRHAELNSYTLLETQLNPAIPAHEFEMTSLDLTYGDRLFDQTTQKLYVYDDQAGFVLATEFTLDPSRVKTTSPK